MFSKKLDEIKENIAETCSSEQVQDCICIGFCILYSFTKKLPEFKAISQMIIELVRSSAIRGTDVEEG